MADRQAEEPLPRTSRSWWRRNPALVIGIMLAVLLVYTAPRLVALHGVTRTVHLGFWDMYYHLVKVDMLVKRQTRGPALMADPFIARHRELLDPYQKMHWNMGIIRLGALFGARFGPQSIWTTQLVNLVFSLLLAAAVMGLGRAMGGWRLGFWGALLSLLCPGLVASTWYFSLDYPLVAMVLAGLFLLWAADGFSRPFVNLMLAGWSGLGMYVKSTYALYLLVPALVALFLGLRRHRPWWRPLAHALLAGVVALGLAALLNGWQLPQLLDELSTHLVGRPEGLAMELLRPWTLRWAAAYAMFAAAVFPWPLLLLALPGLVLCHAGTRSRPLAAGVRPLLLSFLWSTYLLLTLMINKMERYLQVIYPVLCLLTVWWITAVLPRRWRSPALLGCGAVYAAVLCISHLYPTPWYLDERSATTGSYMYEIRMPGQKRLDGLRRNVDHPRCRLGPLVRTMDRLARKVEPQRRPLGLAVLWDRAWPGVDDYLPFTTHHLHLTGMQLLPKRFLVIKDEPNRAELPGILLQVPVLVVLHPRSYSLAQAYPLLREVAALPETVRCDGKDLPLTLSVAVPR